MSVRSFFADVSTMVGGALLAFGCTESLVAETDAGARGDTGAAADAATDGGTKRSYRTAPLTALADPVLVGQFGPDFEFSGDPTVVRVGDEFRMYHTCYAIDRSGADTCLAVSPDGRAWSLVDTGDPNSLGRVLQSDLDAWDAAHETPFAYLRDGQTWLYAVGYAPPSAGFFGATSPRLSVAVSVDGVRFAPTRGPLFETSPGALDSHGLTSPSIVEADGELVLLYTGWCLDPATCPRVAEDKFTALMAATSTDGLSWTKQATPLIVDVDLPWAPGGIAETQVTRDPLSGKYVLSFQAISKGPFVVGVGLADHPLGPWALLPDPILTAAEVGPWANGGIVAPELLIDPRGAWLWFSGEQVDEAGELVTFRIGLATAQGPFLIPE